MKIILSIFLFFCVTVIFADNKEEKTATKINNELAVVDLSGTITDAKTGELLVGVEVSLAGTDQKTYTDFDGNFTFKEVKKGNYNVVSNYISYEKQVKNVKAEQANNRLEIKMQTSK